MTSYEVLPWEDLSASTLTEWDRLLEVSGANLSQCANWIAAIAAARSVADRLEVVLARENDRLLAVLPFYRSRRTVNGIPMRSIELAGNLSSYHQGSFGSAWVELLNECVDHLWRDWDVVVVQNLVDADPERQAILDLGRRGGLSLIPHGGIQSPFLVIEDDWPTYLSRRSKKFRNKIGRFRRRLAELGDFETRWYLEPQAVPQLLNDMVAIESHSWKTGADMAIKLESPEYRYYAVLLPWLAESGRMVANVERLDGWPIAYSLCYRERRVFGQMKTSFNESFAEHSVGTVAISNAIERAFDEGMSEFDFLGDVMPHKTVWTHELRAHTTYYLFGPTLKGRLTGSLKRLRQAFSEDRQGKRIESAQPESR